MPSVLPYAVLVPHSNDAVTDWLGGAQLMVRPLIDGDATYSLNVLKEFDEIEPVMVVVVC